MRILIIRSNPVSPDPRVEKEARSLNHAGYQVSILGWDRNAQLPALESYPEYTLHRLHIKAGYGRGILNLFPLLRWQIGLLGWLLRHRLEYDLLHACDFDTVLPALICKWLYKTPVVYDIFDFYADHLRATPSWIKGIIRRIDLWAVDQADAVILVDDARRAQISAAHPKQLAIVYNTPEEQRLPPAMESTPAGSSLSLAYIGLLQVERGLLDLLRVLQRHPDWHLHLGGFGGDQARILELARQMPNVRWYGRLDYERTLAISQSADALVAIYDPRIPNHRYASPNKLFEAMLLGKAIIVARHTNMDRIVEQEGFGLVVEYGDLKALEAALAHLAENPAHRVELGSRARAAYQSTYNWKLMADRLLALYAQIRTGTGT